MDKPSPDYVRSALDYDAETGIFVWKYRKDQGKRWNSRYAGTKAGTLHGNYNRIAINYVNYYSHVLAWVIATGNWPDNVVDHKDCDPSNNKLSNLRAATNAENARNAKIYSTNTSGIKGLSWRKARRHWVARITVDRKVIRLGSFHDKEKALEAITEARIRYHGGFSKVS